MQFFKNICFLTFISYEPIFKSYVNVKIIYDVHIFRILSTDDSPAYFGYEENTLKSIFKFCLLFLNKLKQFLM